MDINTQLKIVVKTGELSFGYREALKSSRLGRAKLIIYSSTCPNTYKKSLQSVATEMSIPIYPYKGSSHDLGLVCGKRFAISTLTIKKQGDSDILKIGET